MIEEWITIPDYPDYDVSNLGRMRSWRGNGSGVRPKSLKMLVQKIGTNGYLKCELCRGDKRPNGTTKAKTFYLHKTVSRMFIGDCPEGLVTRHTDGNKLNNHVENLSYGTASENIEDKRRHGTLGIGSTHPLSKINESDVIEIRTLGEEGLAPKHIATRFGITTNNVYLILARKAWKHI